MSVWLDECLQASQKKSSVQSMLSNGRAFEGID